jgi:hypothetical protein
MKYGKVLVSLPIFLLSSYEIWESIGFTSGKSKKKIAFFHVLGLIYLKNMFRAIKKKFRLSRGVAAAAAAVDKNLSSPFLSRIER